jgi:hypothetical protein
MRPIQPLQVRRLEGTVDWTDPNQTTVILQSVFDLWFSGPLLSVSLGRDFVKILKVDLRT